MDTWISIWAVDLRLTPRFCLMYFFGIKPGKTFVDITQSSGTGELHKGHGIAFADLERRSGHEDIVAETVVRSGTGG